MGRIVPNGNFDNQCYSVLLYGNQLTIEHMRSEKPEAHRQKS